MKKEGAKMTFEEIDVVMQKVKIGQVLRYEIGPGANSIITETRVKKRFFEKDFHTVKRIVLEEASSLSRDAKSAEPMWYEGHYSSATSKVVRVEIIS